MYLAFFNEDKKSETSLFFSEVSLNLSRHVAVLNLNKPLPFCEKQLQIINVS